MMTVAQVYKSALWRRATLAVNSTINNFIGLPRKLYSNQVLHMSQHAHGRYVSYRITVFDRYNGSIQSFTAKGSWSIFSDATIIPDRYFFEEDDSYDDGLG